MERDKSTSERREHDILKAKYATLEDKIKRQEAYMKSRLLKDRSNTLHVPDALFSASTSTFPSSSTTSTATSASSSSTTNSKPHRLSSGGGSSSTINSRVTSSQQSNTEI